MGTTLAMHDLFLDGIGEVLELIRKRKYNEAQESISRERDRFASTEVLARRRNVDVLVQSILQLDRQIQNVTRHMELISGPGSRELGETIKDYVMELKSEKVRLESMKRYSSRMK